MDRILPPLSPAAEMYFAELLGDVAKTRAEISALRLAAPHLARDLEQLHALMRKIEAAGLSAPAPLPFASTARRAARRLLLRVAATTVGAIILVGLPAVAWVAGDISARSGGRLHSPTAECISPAPVPR